MQAMPAITAAATGRGLSAGALLAFGGGLALYQLTSLVLGPAGTRELQLSLNIPAAEVAEPYLPPASGAALILGTLARPTPAPTPTHRASAQPAAPRLAAPTPSPAISAEAPGVTPPATHPSGKPKPHHDD
jgi:hypothetical protein